MLISATRHAGGTTQSQAPDGVRIVQLPDDAEVGMGVSEERPPVVTVEARPAAPPLRMVNPIRHYDWGSRTRLAALQRRPPSADPEAELWMGAHPNDPSSVLLPGGEQVSLAELLARDPLALLGEETLGRFGPRLPFLLKVLGVERALSVQVHPSRERARAGFLAEEAAGIPRTSPERTYVDEFSKPEFLFALTPFVAMAGFRRPLEALALVDLLGLADLAPLRDTLAASHGAETMAEALSFLVHLPPEQRHPLADTVEQRCRELLDEDPDRPEAGTLGWVIQLALQHPGDPLVSAPLLMRVLHLGQGGTLYLPPGVPHAYLRGTGVEIMSASDNVLRAGLTTKHVAVEDLLAALEPTARPVVGIPSRPDAGEQQTWDLPVAEFSLGRILVSDREPKHATSPTSPLPHILLCTDGEVEVRVDGSTLTLPAGESVFVPAGCGPASISGEGEVFRAGPGRS